MDTLSTRFRAGNREVLVTCRTSPSATAPDKPRYAACAPSARGPSLSAVTSPAPAPSRPRDRFRAFAAGICALQALTLLGFVGFYLWELTQDSADDVARVVMSAVLILVFAGGIAAIAWGWLRG